MIVHKWPKSCNLCHRRNAAVSCCTAWINKTKCTKTFPHHPFRCRVTVLLTSSSIATFSTLHNLSSSKQQPANASSDSATPASCCYILLHTHTNSSAPVRECTKVVLSSVGHAMLLMGTAMGLCGRWVAELQVRFDGLTEAGHL